MTRYSCFFGQIALKLERFCPFCSRLGGNIHSGIHPPYNRQLQALPVLKTSLARNVNNEYAEGMDTIN